MSTDLNWILKHISWDKVDFASLAKKFEETYKKELKDMNHVNILLAGKTGVGKSTLVNAVFRENFAQTASGDPVTQELKVYEREDMPLRIYDSKGLELADESRETLKQEIHRLVREKLSSKNPDAFIHVIWYCISTASDRVEAEELKWLQELSDCGTVSVPVIVVLTKSYSRKNGSILRQFIEEKNLNVKNVIPVLAQRFELDETQFVQPYGLETLVRVTMELLPEAAKKAFVNSQQVDIHMKEESARKYVHRFAAAAMAEGAAPIPLADAPFIVATQVTMIGAITATFGVDLDKAMFTAILTSILGTGGATLIGRTVAGSLFKMIPGAGTVVGGAISGGTAMVLTKALGETYIQIMKMLATGEISKSDLNKGWMKRKMHNIFKSQYKEDKED